MPEALLRRLGQHYIFVMMVLTRLFGSVGGLLVIYYVELALELPPVIRHHFHVAALVVVVFSCSVTVLLALWETRRIRGVLRELHEGREPAAERCQRAAKEAIAFTGLHHCREAWVVPLTTLVPVLIFLRAADGTTATAAILMNITIACFMGIAMALMSTYFAVNQAMQPVIHRLLDRCPAVSYEELPESRLILRFGLCSTLIIVITALMIGTLASQRAAHVLDQPDRQFAEDALKSLHQHTVYITIAAVVLGVTFSAVLATSVTSRIRRLVEAMESVSHGELSLRVRPTGTDEVDRLGRRFNDMLADLEQSNRTVQELNQHLEHKVEERTQELESALVELRATQSQLTDLAHSAGMAEIATGVLHNVGNLLNSVNVSVAVVTARLRDSRLEDLDRTLKRLAAQSGPDGPGAFLAAEGRGEKLLSYLKTLSSRLQGEHDDIGREVRELSEKVDNVKAVIAAQQNYARRVSFREDVDLERMIRDVLAMHGPSFARHRIDVETETEALPPVQIEKSKLVQVLDNLVRNAVESIRDHRGEQSRLTVSLRQSGPDRARIVVADTGGGIEADKLDRIFSYGYTTKRDGNGFGLHSAALAVNALGGSISATSDGAGRGACFTVDLPTAADAATAAELQLA